MSTETITMADDVNELNVTLLPPKLKHPTIFERFDLLQPGEAFRILNDHDPKPLYYQLIAERGNIFSWTYLEKGPVWWKVQIKKSDTEKGETIGQIAAKDMRKAEVFKKYGIDFCCGGKKSLQEVCEEKRLNQSAIEAELNGNNAIASDAPVMNFHKWDADFLADYIYNQHHKYYYTEEPAITGLVNKVADHHGGTNNSLLALRSTYNVLIKELNTHFMKEEKVVFPFIKSLVQAKNTGDRSLLPQQMALSEPIRIMESDHEAAGEILEQIRTLTDNYTPPANACNSYQFMFKKLKELDEDLHQHIHLENNILFPKALAIEKELRN
jgi:regulator of cell morphogenesis and NO signaling